VGRKEGGREGLSLGWIQSRLLDLGVAIATPAHCAGKEKEGGREGGKKGENFDFFS